MTSLAPSLRVAIGGIYVLLLAASAADVALRRLRPGLDLAEVSARIRTWWAMAIAFTVVVVVHPGLSVAFFAVASALAAREYFHITGAPARSVAYGAVAAQYGAVAAGRLDLVPLVAVLSGLAVPAVLVLQARTGGFAAATGSALLGIGLTVFGLGHAAFLLEAPEAAAAPAGAAGLLVFVVVLTQCNDVAQFVWGKALGGRKVAPVVSPGKTVAGLAGGVATTAVLAAAAAPLLTVWSPLAGAAIGIGLALAGFAGDLTMSAVKRDAGVKDSGALLPGHGGALDRLDSLIFTAPLFFHLVRLAG